MKALRLTAVAATAIVLLYLAISFTRAPQPSSVLSEGHPDMYVQYHHDIRASENGENEYPMGYRMTELRKAREASKTPDVKLNWVERGPGNVGGRTRALLLDPDDATLSTWWAGSVTGGLWKTTDGGFSWRPLTDHFPTLAVSTLAMSNRNRNVLYMGTGATAERFSGDGIFRSSDRGVTWEHLRATVNDNFRAVNKVVVHPADENIVMAATEEGIFRSFDGGQSWTAIFSDSYVQDLRVQPGNYNVQIAAGGYNGIFYSQDAGRTWQSVLSNVDSVDHFRRIELAYSPSDPDIAYAAIEASPLEQLYRSDDGGLTWVATVDTTEHPINWMHGRGWWNNALAVHPYDPNIVFTGGVYLFTSYVSGQSPGPYIREVLFDIDRPPHVDHHVLMPIPINSSTGDFWILNANDGGVAISKDNGKNYREQDENGAGYNTTQFYGVAKRPGKNVYIAGSQDNGTWRSTVNSGARSEWDKMLYGDGFETLWHATDPSKLLGSVQYSTIYRSVDGGESWTPSPDMFFDRENGQFYTTLAGSDQEPDNVYTTKRDGVYYSRDFGATWNLTPMSEGWVWWSGCTVRVSPVSPNVVWAGCGFDTGPLNTYHVSHDYGESFIPVVLPNRRYAPFARTSGFVPHPTEEGTAYALFSRSRYLKVLELKDYGQTWTDLSQFDYYSGKSANGFPDVAVYDLLVMPHSPNTIWVGTEIGVFRSTNSGEQWYYADDGLPAVPVWRMKIRDDQVILGTHGRGVWTVPLSDVDTRVLAFIHSVSDQIFTKNVTIAPIELPEATGGDASLGYTLRPELPAGLKYDAATRTISGTPTVSMGSTSYTYTATDASSKSTSLAFKIKVAIPVRILGSIDDQSFARGQPIASLVLPRAVGGASPVTHTLTPELPSGLSFHDATRTISGTPVLVSDATTYTYATTGANGSTDKRTFSIEVYSPVSTEHESLPATFALRGNYPNPFQNTTQIVFDLPSAATVSVDVLDVSGRRVLSVPSRRFPAGWERSMDLSANSLPAGVYLYRLHAISLEGEVVRTGRFIRIR